MIAFYRALLRLLLFGVAANDQRTFLAAVAPCIVTAVIGCLRPALHAARVDPMTALREGWGCSVVYS